MAYQRGEPSIQPGSQQLAYGGAQQANAGVPEFSGADYQVQYAPDREDPEEPDTKASDNMQILLQPPDPGYAPRLVNPAPGKVPTSVLRDLPKLQAAANDPDAPITLKALYRAILAHAERG